MSASCTAFAPAFLCAHLDLLLYLVPSAALAVVIGILSRIHPFFFLFTVAGTICHELAHFLVGAMVGAGPASLSIIPRRLVHRDGRTQWRLGSVTLTRVRWYNAAPAALAPLLILAVPLAVAWWRTRAPWRFGPMDLAIALALAPQFLSFWPSRPDWAIAARSWPYVLIMLAVLGALLLWHPGVFQHVKS